MIFNDRKKRTLALLLILVLSLVAFAGCSKDSDDEKTEGNTETEVEKPQGDLQLTLSIKFPDKSKDKNIESKAMALPDGSSALDILWAYANENQLTVETEDDETPYVTKIGETAADDKSGWVFTVNGETIMESAGKTILKDGDEVLWEYTTW